MSFSTFQTITIILSAIILFLHSLSGFSREINLAGENYLKKWLGKATDKVWKSFLLGTVFTAVMQSSSAVSAMAIALVDSQILTLQSSLSILLGANIGTCVTSWMVSFKLTSLGPIFIVLGTFIGFFNWHGRILGKPIFYLGFIFFALDLISQALIPVKENELIVTYIAQNQNPLIGVFIGVLITALVQSSSVTSGLAVVLVMQSVISLPVAIALVVGSNIGTTTTGLIASLSLGINAKRSAVANCIFNITGVLILIPFFNLFVNLVNQLTQTPYFAVSIAHLLLNVFVAIIFIFNTRRVNNWLLFLIPEPKKQLPN